MQISSTYSSHGLPRAGRARAVLRILTSIALLGIRVHANLSIINHLLLLPLAQRMLVWLTDEGLIHWALGAVAVASVGVALVEWLRPAKPGWATVMQALGLAPDVGKHRRRR